MVHPLKRMTKLHRKLLWIRFGPGAIVLPKEVSKISMEMSTKIYGGHHGARYACSRIAQTARKELNVFYKT
ncbi:hypothetical protein A1F99_067050 [Pyrenophora tritici-repentis]|nr:hypothetical protein A1F99_067050 [Pyrenophora tritici-repentis]